MEIEVEETQLIIIRIKSKGKFAPLVARGMHLDDTYPLCQSASKLSPMLSVIVAR